MKFKGTVSFLGRTGILTLDIPSVTEGRTSEEYRNFNPVTGCIRNSACAVKAFNEAVTAFDSVINRSPFADIAKDDMYASTTLSVVDGKEFRKVEHYGETDKPQA